MAHTAHKISVGGGYGTLPLGHHAHVAAQTGAAGGGGHRRAGLNEGLDQPLPHSLEDNLLGGGNHNAAHVGGHLFALHNGGGDAQVADAAVGAGADYHLVDGGSGHLRHYLGVLRQVGQRHGGLQLVQVN